MVRLVTDINFSGPVVRGLLARQPLLDLVRAQDVGLDRATDPELLAWAADHDRIVVSHDRKTLPGHAYARIARGERMPGAFILAGDLPVGQAITELLTADGCSEQHEWADRVEFLPL